MSVPALAQMGKFVYCIARAIHRGWIDPIAYGPVATLGWNALMTKVNAQGQVEGVCAGHHE